MIVADIGLGALLLLNLVFAIRLDRRLRALREMQGDLGSMGPAATSDLLAAVAAVRAQAAEIATAQASLDEATRAAQALRRDVQRLALERAGAETRTPPQLARGLAAYAAQAEDRDAQEDTAPPAYAPPRAVARGETVIAMPVRSKAELALEAALRRRR